jgi:Macro domain.
MKYEETYKDLFTVSEEYYLAHCISSDAAMGAGIAVEFRKRFGLGSFQEHAKSNPYPIGTCQKVGRVLNLITKKVYYGKPTYQTFEASIEDMKQVAMNNGINKIAMPQIGAGLDRLSWAKNREIIQNIFNDTDIEILVCRFK